MSFPFVDILEQAHRLFQLFGMPRLFLAYESHDQSFSLWNLSHPTELMDLFVVETRIPLCYLTRSMVVDPEIIDMLPELELRWMEYAENIVLPPANTRFDCFLPATEDRKPKPTKEN